MKPGIYKHYKGNKYLVLETCRHSETLEEMVVYRCLYGEYGLWVRPIEMFTETIEVNGEQIQRFKYLHPTGHLIKPKNWNNRWQFIVNQAM